jgi:hypothetical protein
MKTHAEHAAMTEARFAVMVLKSVFKRLGAWSIHRPKLAEKQIDAKVVTIPLFKNQHVIR